MGSLLERSKVESRYAEPTKHKAQEFVEKFPQCVSAADPEFFRTKAVQAKDWLEAVQKFLGWYAYGFITLVVHFICNRPVADKSRPSRQETEVDRTALDDLYKISKITQVQVNDFFRAAMRLAERECVVPALVQPKRERQGPAYIGGHLKGSYLEADHIPEEYRDVADVMRSSHPD